MANIKSAKKRIITNRNRAMRNKSIKSSVKTSIKKVITAIEAKDKDAAAKALTAAEKALGKATAKGVYHRNTSSRRVSRLTRAVAKM